MRWLACCTLASVVLGCGQSRSQSTAAGAGNANGATSGTRGGAAVSGSGGAATSADGGMTTSAAGSDAGGELASAGSGAGRAGVGRGGGSPGGAGNGSAGTGATTTAGGVANGGSGGDGAGGDEGAAGAPDFVCRNLTACGCGCCADSNPKVTCYYPEYGDDLTAIKDADDLESMSPSCDSAACGPGIHYVCCATPSEPNDGQYTALIHVDGSLIIEHEAPGGVFCQFLVLLTSPEDAGTYPHVDLPEGYWLQLPREEACRDSGFRQGSAGAFGWVRITPSCTLDFDVSVAFGYQPENIVMQRLVASDLPVDGLVCP